jgi:nucleotide-binding universal stress UspA family protein
VSNKERNRTIKRILVALDASVHSLAALEAAVELAARLSSELIGVYVEDADLLRMAELPFVREISPVSARSRRFNGQEAERQFRAQAVRIHRSLHREAKRTQVRWSFQIKRGSVASALLRAASEVDLIVLGKAGWPVTTERRLGSTARVVLSRVPGLALIVQHGARLRSPVAVVYDGSSLGRKALRVAESILPQGNGHLDVFLLSPSLDAVDRLQSQARQSLEGKATTVRYRILTGTNVSRLVQIMQSDGVGTLVVPATSAIADEEALIELLDRLESPVLLVR